MFLQFSDLLGIRTNDPMLMYPAKTVKGLALAEQATIELARQETADVEVMSMKKTATDLEVKVRVKEQRRPQFPVRRLVPPRLPRLRGARRGGQTDVGIRRHESVRNDHERSGGPILPSEFFDGGAYQDHHKVISDQSKVQIYEELVKDTEGHFTTSFLSLFDNMKKNRLLPRGWKPTVRTRRRPHRRRRGEGSRLLERLRRETIIYYVPLAEGSERRSKSRRTSITRPFRRTTCASVSPTGMTRQRIRWPRTRSG